MTSHQSSPIDRPASRILRGRPWAQIKDRVREKTSRFRKTAAAQLFWVALQPVDVLCYTPLDVVLWSIAHFFLDPSHIQISIRSVSRATSRLQTDLGIGDHRFH